MKEPSSLRLTEEQKQVIEHPDGYHGKVLAVAGSGKTTTMAYRILHLIHEQKVSAHQIQVLMFNRLAQDQFVETLAKAGLEEGHQPAINTFHSYAYRLIPNHFKQWIGPTDDLGHLALLRSRTSVCSSLKLNTDDLDIDLAKQAISRWKSALIPPSYAGYEGNHSEAYIELYREYEERRHRDNAITFDDFVPLAIHGLEASPHLIQNKASQIRYLIVDEYQDVNLGQQRLVELLASHGADLMVVGDDDQTIYEWRGARSDYILGEYENTFTNKPHVTYKLTRSFRFGYLIAQTSCNVIQHNAHRLEKHVISSNPAVKSEVTVITDSEEQGGYANRRLMEEIVALVHDKKAVPSDIRVLARTYAQLNSLQTELLLQRIPFKVIRNAPMFEAGECQSILKEPLSKTGLSGFPGSRPAAKARSGARIGGSGGNQGCCRGSRPCGGRLRPR